MTTQQQEPKKEKQTRQNSEIMEEITGKKRKKTNESMLSTNILKEYH